MQQWIWCLECERAFAIELARRPEWDVNEQDRYPESSQEFTSQLETQIGVPYPDGYVYIDCPYNDCDGELSDFVWWEEYRSEHPEAPQEPERGRAYKHDD